MVMPQRFQMSDDLGGHALFRRQSRLVRSRQGQPSSRPERCCRKRDQRIDRLPSGPHDDTTPATIPRLAVSTRFAISLEDQRMAALPTTQQMPPSHAFSKPAPNRSSER